MQLFDAGGNPVERAMRGLAEDQRVGAEGCRPRRWRSLGDRSRLVDQPPQPLTNREAPCTRSSLQITSRSGANPTA